MSNNNKNERRLKATATSDPKRASLINPIGLIPNDPSFTSSTSLMDRLRTFLPKMAAADSQLAQEKNQLPADAMTAKYDIENISSDTEKFIEMVS